MENRCVVRKLYCSFWKSNRFEAIVWECFVLLISGDRRDLSQCHPNAEPMLSQIRFPIGAAAASPPPLVVDQVGWLVVQPPLEPSNWLAITEKSRQPSRNETGWCSVSYHMHYLGTPRKKKSEILKDASWNGSEYERGRSIRKFRFPWQGTNESNLQRTSCAATAWALPRTTALSPAVFRFCAILQLLCLFF